MHTTADKKDKGNPYTLMLLASMPPEIRAVDFHWARAIAGRLDVIHLHWPELLLRDPHLLRRGVKKILFTMMFLRLIISSTPIVQTVHNITPHEDGSRYERRILAALSRRTGSWIVLNPTPVEIASGRVVQILHGHYRDWFADCARPATQPGRYLFFGLIRPYKQVGTLIDAYLELNDPSTSLRIVGASADPVVEEKVAAMGEHRPGISVDFTFVSDQQLARELGRAELVVLPYKEFYNSGAALLALSLGRPVLTPRSEASVALQDEFGSEWVLLFDGDLCGAHLKDALALLRSQPARDLLPDLSRREWDAISAAHTELYVSIAS
jgi:beta-1,4-mannosyltransferase